ncbi:MAG: hypothetical protein JSS03_09850, partial [Proteobacteria bacterium]|nr:hypothetical protein [Pseudomonadota bacterium]
MAAALLVLPGFGGSFPRRGLRTRRLHHPRLRHRPWLLHLRALLVDLRLPLGLVLTLLHLRLPLGLVLTLLHLRLPLG